MNRFSFFLLFACATMVTCAPSEAQNAPRPAAKRKTKGETKAKGERIREAWYAFEFAGNKIGYIKAIDERTSVNGRPAYHLHRWSKLTVKRREEVVDIESTTDSWFSVDGAPMRFKHSRSEGAESRSIDGYRDGDVFVLRQSVGKNLTEKKIPISPDLRLSSSLEVLLADNLKVGAQMKGRVIDESQADVLPFTASVASVDSAKVYTVKQQVGPINAVVKMAADGTIIDVALPDMGVRQKKVSEQEAVRMTETVDLFSAALFKMPRPLPPRDDIEQLIVRLSSKQGRQAKAVIDDRQSSKMRGKDAMLTIKVQRAPSRKLSRPVSGAKWQRFLSSTEYEPLDDERLRATAERLVDGKKTVWSAARAINAFVYKHIGNKSLARAYASAPEALATGEGDCTEHAVLFSALAKIAGIPTRLVTGLVYVGGAENVFGYHEWVEIWSGDQWLAMDPTFGQDVADATHIKLHAGLSDAEGLRAAGQVAAGAIGDLNVE
ncbi:MAG: transglutaminase-like domain-containing protein, partial [Myxococcota bacterium]